MRSIRDRCLGPGPGRQRGASLVEFSLVAAFLFTLILAVFEFGRLMLVWNSAVEATTLGARIATVCSKGTSTSPPAAAVAKMEAVLPGISNAVVIEYLDASGSATSNCNSTNTNACYLVRARLDGPKFVAQFSTPLLSFGLDIPSFTTVITAEALDSAANPRCV